MLAHRGAAQSADDLRRDDNGGGTGISELVESRRTPPGPERVAMLALEPWRGLQRAPKPGARGRARLVISRIIGRRTSRSPLRPQHPERFQCASDDCLATPPASSEPAVPPGRPPLTSLTC